MALIPTHWGFCGIVWKNLLPPDTPFAQRPANPLLRRIVTPGDSPAQLRKLLLHAHPACQEIFPDRQGVFHPHLVPEWFGELVHYLQAFYDNGLRDWTQPQFVDHWTYWKPRLDWSMVTPFQRQVLEATACIRCGLKKTYGEIAAGLGKPRAGRAVGASLGANPWPVLIPCHRVVGHNGQLVGFSATGGVAVKKKMLALERPGLFEA